MPPNSTTSTLLSYENEDVELLPTYLKRGKYGSFFENLMISIIVNHASLSLFHSDSSWCVSGYSSFEGFSHTLCVFLNDHCDHVYIYIYIYPGYRTLPLLWVNGARVPDTLAAQARPNQTLLSFLRDVMLLKGSKLGCAEGGCGACTVMISKMIQQPHNQHDDDDIAKEGGKQIRQVKLLRLLLFLHYYAQWMVFSLTHIHDSFSFLFLIADTIPSMPVSCQSWPPMDVT
jgi:2Fe-2S iron-sulfur cluster binding domain